MYLTGKTHEKTTTNHRGEEHVQGRGSKHELLEMRFNCFWTCCVFISGRNKFLPRRVSVLSVFKCVVLMTVFVIEKR